jgi:hypothetical protein
MHANDVFSFFKSHFWHQHIKTIENIQTILNFNKKKIQIFRNAAAAAFPNEPLVNVVKNSAEFDQNWIVNVEIIGFRSNDNKEPELCSNDLSKVAKKRTDGRCERIWLVKREWFFIYL